MKYRATVAANEHYTYDVFIEAESEQEAKEKAERGDWEEVINEDFEETLDRAVLDLEAVSE